jgi:hypothetical protein
MTTFANRVFLSARLDGGVYEEVESDRAAMGQAICVVILSSLAAGAGVVQQIGTGGIITGTVSALVGWYIWAGLTYLIGTRILPEPQTRANYGELLRTVGFASSPGIIRFLGIIPGLTAVVFFVAGIWMLVATVVAVRQALDYRSTWRALGVCLIGWIIQVLILVIVFAFNGAPAPEAGA